MDALPPRALRNVETFENVSASERNGRSRHVETFAAVSTSTLGEAKHGGSVNAATGTVTLKPGEQVKIPVKMLPDTEFEGKFTLKALDPKTFTVYASLDLKTDYMV